MAKNAAEPFPGEDLVLAGVDRALWAELVERLAGEGSWHKYSKNAPWSFRVKRGPRAIVYLIPGADGFAASFALGERALALARDTGLGAVLEGARKYAEGTAVRVAVRDGASLEVVLGLAQAKIAS